MNKNNENQFIKIKGVLEKIIFENPESNFVIGKLRTEVDNELITIIGNAIELKCGENIEVSGKWVLNKKYGRQFKIESIETFVPATIEGLEKYLGSGLIKGIGPVMANKIVSKFKLDTLKILDNEPEQLTKIEGFGKKRVKMILKEWDKHKDIRKVMIFLKSYGISNNYSMKIYNFYDKNLVNVIKQNPYRLINDIPGMGFKTADRIAEKAGIEKDSMFRIRSGIIYLLKKIEDDGHCYFPYDDFIEMCSAFMEVDMIKITHALESLKKEEKIFIEDDDVKKIYLKSIYDAELYVSDKLAKIAKENKRVRNIKSKYNSEEIIKIIKRLAKENNKSLDFIQIEAIKQAIINSILIITGSPGTGKSTILNFVIKFFENEDIRVILAAPTGRASKRLSETTGKDAKTIHRLLKYQPKLNKFIINKNNPLVADVIIIDEASMIDIRLLKSFLEAVRNDTSIIFVGDNNQLPSVGPGNVLGDMINSDKFSVVELKKIYRQEGKSLIIYNSHRVRDGVFPIISKPKYNDFFFIEKVEPKEVVNMIINLISEKIPGRFNYNPLLDIQVLVPTNKGIVGVNNLNIEIQAKINSNSFGVFNNNIGYKLNDKVIQLKNNYDKDIYNGDIGFIKKIDLEMKEIYVDFDGKYVSYNFYELDEISLSYAISIHKSQGSEFKCVIIPILTSHYMLLQRNLLYTAITRAKEVAIVVGSKKAIGIAINRNIVKNRYTGLKKLLKNNNKN